MIGNVGHSCGRLQEEAAFEQGLEAVGWEMSGQTDFQAEATERSGCGQMEKGAGGGAKRSRSSHSRPVSLPEYLGRAGGWVGL